MTILAYRDGALVADSQITLSGAGCGEYKLNGRKLFRIHSRVPGFSGEAIFGYAGACPVGAMLRRYAMTGVEPDFPAEGNADAILLLPCGLVWFDRALEVDELTDPYGAWGSGAKAALGAMFVGATARQAVQAAIACDPNCGGPIVEERL